jgi:SSS family solute:Na+ symporter
VAAIFAASMDSNLNSMATLTLRDVYLRYARPGAGERESLRFLRLATLCWGVVGTAIGLAMIGADSALAAWWRLASLFSGGVLGLFLLGVVSRANNVAGSIGVVAGVLVMTWMTLPSLAKSLNWELPRLLTTSLHANMTIVIGTLTIFFIGLLITSLRSPPLGGKG